MRRAQRLEVALQGAVFPLSGSQLVRVARENAAPPSLLTLLSVLPVRPYSSLEAVRHALKELQTHCVTSPGLSGFAE